MLDHHNERLAPAKILFAGGVGTFLALISGGLIWYSANRGFHVVLKVMLFGAERVLTLPILLYGTVAVGALATTTLFVLNELTQRPVRLFRFLALIFFLASCLLLLSLPLAANSRLIGLMIITFETAALVTPLTRHITV